jgi:hypothetical protein
MTDSTPDETIAISPTLLAKLLTFFKDFPGIIAALEKLYGDLTPAATGSLTVEQTVTLGALSGIIAAIDGLLAAGVTTAQLAETVAKFVDPSAVPALAMFITVLQEAEALLKKV